MHAFGTPTLTLFARALNGCCGQLTTVLNP